MKIALPISLAAICLAAQAQTNAPVISPDASAALPSITTNYVKAHWSFRRVDGKLYNTEKSVLWRDIKGMCAKVLTNGTIVRTVVDKSESFVIPPSDSGTSISNILLGGRTSAPSVQTRKWQEEGPTIFLANYEGPEPTVGNAIRAKAIKVGTYTYEGDVIEKWDCGTPNIVPVIVTNTPATQTNSNHLPAKTLTGK